MRTFHEAINIAWRKSGLKKGDFADQCGVCRQMMSRYLSGKSTPDFNRSVEIMKNAGYNVQISLPLGEKEDSHE